MQRIIGIVLGAVVTYLALVVLDALGSAAQPRYGIAVILGAIVSLLWPWLIGYFLLRGAEQRRSNEVGREVAKRMSDDRNDLD